MDRCQLDFKFKDEKGRAIYHLPLYRPENVTPEDVKEGRFDLIAYFKEQAEKGLQARFLEPVFKSKTKRPDWEELRTKYDSRQQDELSMIVKTGFSGYFLIVADFINWANTERNSCRTWKRLWSWVSGGVFSADY